MNEFLNKVIDFIAENDSRRVTLEKYYYPGSKPTHYARLEEEWFDEKRNRTYYFMSATILIDEFTYKKASEFLEHKEFCTKFYKRS